MILHFPVTLCIATRSGVQENYFQAFTPQTWKSAASILLEERDRIVGPRRCLIDFGATADPEGAEEHVIPQGTGIRWIYLPPPATAHASNNGASCWEKEFLQLGLMGMLRPFYVEGKKVAEFPLEDGRKIIFRNDPDRGFRIETIGFEPLPLPKYGGGSIEFKNILIREAPTSYVSRSITKIAYLTLAAIQPSLALSPLLDDVRHYLVAKDAPYRPYGERFCPGAQPRAEARFDALGEYASDNKFSISRLFAKIFIHHVEYLVPLIGDAPKPMPTITGLEWFGESEPARKRHRCLTWSYDNTVPSE